MTQAEKFNEQFGYDTLSNGYTSRSLSVFPSKEHAEDTFGELGYAWVFPDGSRLFYHYNNTDATWWVYCTK